jgi:hypothetical protein
VTPFPRRLLVLVAFLASSPLLASCPGAEDLRIETATPKDSYLSCESIPIQIELSNEGKSEVLIEGIDPLDPGSEALRFTLEDVSTGKQLGPFTAQDAWLRRGIVLESEEEHELRVERIEPGQRRIFAYDLLSMAGPVGPGDYRVVVGLSAFEDRFKLLETTVRDPEVAWARKINQGLALWGSKAYGPDSVLAMIYHPEFGHLLRSEVVPCPAEGVLGGVVRGERMLLLWKDDDEIVQRLSASVPGPWHESRSNGKGLTLCPDTRAEGVALYLLATRGRDLLLGKAGPVGIEWAEPVPFEGPPGTVRAAWRDDGTVLVLADLEEGRELRAFTFRDGLKPAGPPAPVPEGEVASADGALWVRPPPLEPGRILRYDGSPEAALTLDWEVPAGWRLIDARGKPPESVELLLVDVDADSVVYRMIEGEAAVPLQGADGGIANRGFGAFLTTGEVMTTTEAQFGTSTSQSEY